MAKRKNKKQHKPLKKTEFIFILLSLIIIICIGIYFGARSFYYYSKQSSSKNQKSTTLVEKIKNDNQITKENDGLHQDAEGYYFKGNVINNYVKFANRYFRIIRINTNDTVKLISEDNSAIFMWGEDNKYQKSNLNLWLTKTDDNYSGIYYDTIPEVNKFLVKTKYTEDTLLDEKIKQGKKEYKDYITTLTVSDYTKAQGKKSYLNTNKYSWVIGNDNDGMNLYIDEDGNIESATSNESFGVRAVITLKKNIKIISGDGTSNNPYIIDQKSDTNYVDQYVKLGNDTWKIYYDKDDILKLSLNGYISSQTGELLYNFSNTTSIFNSLDRNNIAYYLNNNYYNSLSYNNLLGEMTYLIGEISNDTGLNYLNIYNANTINKVGILNIFDYNTNKELNNYYFINNTSTVGSMAYVYNNLGILEEEKVTEKKHVVPTIMISKNIIKSGDGTLENPYVVE